MKNEIIFVCSNCGEEYLKWQGKCENCGSWNTLKDFSVTSKETSNKFFRGEPTFATEIAKVKTSNFKRISTTFDEFDRVLGGEKSNAGIVPGSVILLGGDPGIGKSTLLLELAANLGGVLYVSGEESCEQIKMRFDRLGLKSKNMLLLAEIDLNAVIEAIKTEKPKAVVVDSIQTVYSKEYPSTPGSLVQVRECALRLQQVAKTTMTPIILVGHVTKEGSVAGPRTLEHLVDVVLYLEGERYYNNRILRGAKNRFGATDEIGIFEMTEKGLKEVTNPSKLFIESRSKNIPGNIVAATVEGSRALLIEVQALTAKTTFGYPQRKASGFDLNRLQLLIAVLQKRAKIDLSNQDVFINIVGGIKAKEPAVDLAVTLAIAGAFTGKPIDNLVCAFDEVGLSGEIRKVSMESKRMAEARRLGFSKFINNRFLSDAIDALYV